MEMADRRRVSAEAEGGAGGRDAEQRGGRKDDLRAGLERVAEDGNGAAVIEAGQRAAAARVLSSARH